MGIFGDAKPVDAVAGDDSREGAENEKPGAGDRPTDKDSGPVNPAVDAARARLESVRASAGDAGTTGKRKRGRPTKTDVEAEKLAALERMNAAMDELYNADNFRALVSLPADIGEAITGHAHWQLSQKEEKILASTGAAAAKAMQLDPKWFAVSAFALSFLVAYSGRIIKELAIRRAERQTPIASKGDAT